MDKKSLTFRTESPFTLGAMFFLCAFFALSIVLMPQQVMAQSSIAQVAVGSDHACALK